MNRTGHRHCMSALARLLMMAALSCLALANESEDLPLPRWSPAELDTMRGVPGAQAVQESMLWPPGMLDITPPVTLPSYMAEADSPDADQPHADVSLFLPPSLLARPKALPDPGSWMTEPLKREVSAEFMRQAVASPAEIHLVDPGQALLPAYREDLARFVESHARDARIKLYVLVLGVGEKLPGRVDLTAIAQGGLGHGECSLLVYPLGDPWRARLFMSRSVSSVVPAAELNDLLVDARQDAFQAETKEDQLHRMLVRLSIRLFWLERLLTQPHETIARAIPLASETPLPEVGAGQDLTNPVATALPWKWVSLLLTAGFAAWAAWRWRCYKLRHYEWLLPVPETIEPRYGAAHCASGVWVSYR